MICKTQSEKLYSVHWTFWMIHNISSISKKGFFWSGIYEGIWNDYLVSVSTALYLSAHHSCPSRRSCCWLQKDENCKLHSSKMLSKMKALRWEKGAGMHVGCWRFFKVVEHVVTHDGWMEETRRCFFFYESHNYHCRAHLSWILGGPGQAPRLHWYSDRLSNTSGWSKWTRRGRGFSNICRCPKARRRPSSASSSCSGASEALGAASAHWRCSLVGLADLDLLHLLLARAEMCCPSPSYWWRGPVAARGHAY